MPQMNAMKKGFDAAVQPYLLYLLNPSYLEYLVCGAPDFTVDDLKRIVRYKDNLTEDDTRIIYFWSVISGFDIQKRMLFLKFVSGRERLPPYLKIKRSKVSNGCDLYVCSVL